MLLQVKLLLCFGMCIVVQSKRVLVEMSHPYDSKTVSPPNPIMWKYKMENINRGPWKGHGGIWFEMNNYKMNEHAGTHVDAPTHFNEYGWDPAEIPLEKLYDIPAVVIDIRQRSALDPHAQLEQADLEVWEKVHGTIPNGAAILVDSGWSDKYGSPEFTSIVRDENGTITDMKFPSISPGAAQWMVDKRPNISCVGIDTTSIEYEPGYDYPTHRILLGKNIYAIENLANPGKLPAAGAKITILPIRLSGGSGAAARIVGVYDDEDDDNSSAMKSCALAKLTYSVIVFVLIFF